MPDGPPVRVNGCPTQTGPLSAAVGAGNAPTVTVFEQDAEHPPVFVTATPSWTAASLPAVHVISRVPAPAVIVPPMMDHPYEAPAPASATDAVFPALAAHTPLGAVMVHAGDP